MQEQNNQNDELSLGLKILSFCIPLAGAVIYFMNKGKSPNKAKTACYAALIGIAVGIVFQVLATVAGFSGN
ncbi:hypothetical protein [Siansivirga zeaxanthinifaciens]|uniref:Uncharacterized protein n=1 Tax=Siansivirga zeaxanthinifaciens CC-SAMT-1 TaxID=1454006 RepID=A0A0C5WKL3_9FLAO|nr:hypothetical protein [Siansivirga zeaxanthinifaciens]AJR03320.1 hypothetical protein AW14_06290 [Siansivirga zeaxanthinifaciens CC-SAMT-1]